MEAISNPHSEVVVASPGVDHARRPGPTLAGPNRSPNPVWGRPTQRSRAPPEDPLGPIPGPHTREPRSKEAPQMHSGIGARLRSTHRSRAAVATLGSALALVFLIVAFAQASIPSAGGTITGCYKKNQGQLRV